MNNVSKQPLLSICIPTYNRAEILDFVLKQYTSNPEFNDEVEIVISDNASTDETQKVCERYINEHSNIRYNRNKINVNDANFPIVLDLAKGSYIKLSNDWVYLNPIHLKEMKDIIRENINERRPVFFSNDWIDTSFRHKKRIVCSDLDEYVKVVSTYVTSNNIFGAWKEQWAKIKDKNANADKKLNQVGWTYQIVKDNNGCIIYNQKIFSNAKVRRKALGGYNWFQVHLDNYYQIMKPYIDNGFISTKTYKGDKRQLLRHFRFELCQIYIWNYSKRWRFEKKGTTKLLWKYYKKDPYAYFFFLSLPLYDIKDITHKIIRKTIQLFKKTS